jgi:hypothetical protein
MRDPQSAISDPQSAVRRSASKDRRLAMAVDRYVKVILTVIALELLWLGVRDTAQIVQAQTPQQPMQVVITGFKIGKQEYTTLPVAVVGSWKQVPEFREGHLIQPLPVVVDARQPLTVQTGNKPLSVESVPAKPSPRPGLE